MSQIKQLIILHQQGKGRKTIARLLGMSKNTVKSYLEKITTLTEDKRTGLCTKDLLSMEAPVLEAKLHAGNPAYKDLRFDELKPHLDDYLKELKGTGVNKHLLWQEYRQSYTQGYSYSQFCFHLLQHQRASKPSMPLEHKAGEKLFIDFAGKPLYYVDRNTGEMVKCQVFVACLPYSDYSFVMAVKDQSTEEFLHALSCCLKALGGVPQALVPDNLKAAVIKASRYEPTINVALEDFANHYQTTVIPARARKPKDKALVENQVKLIYSRVYAKLRKRTFFDLASLNEAITVKVKEHNQTRMQQNPYCREEKFLSEEKNLLQPLPSTDFEIKHYTRLTVAKNNHVYLSEDKHYYSVPYTLIGCKVKVIYTRSMVYIFNKGEQVALHVRSYQKNRYTTHKDHLCSAHQHYLDRSPDYYMARASKVSVHFEELIRKVFQQKKYPEQLYRTCDGLLSLSRKTDPQHFNKAVCIAIDYQNYNYMFIKNILENNMLLDQYETPPEQSLPDHQNLRGRQYYQ